MKPHFIVLTLIACGAAFSALAVWPAHRAQPKPQVTAIQLDLVALQQQADAALENLRRAQQFRPAPVVVAERRYSQLVPAK